jgi:hypothetical protein
MILSYKDGVPYSQGSGFFIDKNTLITNLHCVEGSERIEFNIAGRREIYKGAKIEKASPEFDLAIIKTTQDFPYLKIDSLCEEKIGSKVYAIGNPRGLEGTISDGILSGKRNEDGIEYLQITAPINPGNSGGPILNEYGNVIGVSTFTFKNSQNLNFAVPIKYIAQCDEYTFNPTKEKKVLNITTNNAISIPKLLIVSQYDPCKAIISIRNNTEHTISGILGQMVFYDKEGEMYDYLDFEIDQHVYPQMTKQVNIRIGDDRIHPGQYWGTPEQLNYKLSNTPKIGVFRFRYSGGSSGWLINLAKQIELRIIYYNIDE